VRYALAQSTVMSPVHRAVDSNCWIVAVDGDPGTFFLKILNDDLITPVNVAAAYRAADAASRQGLTPRPLYLIEGANAAVFDLLGSDWRTAHMDDLSDLSIFEKVIAAKHAIHDLAPFDRDIDVFVEIERLAMEAETRGVSLPSNVSVLLAAVACMRSAISAAGIDRRPCHADGVSSNVMIGPGEAVQLVDFDEAGNADPLFDLAVLFNEACPFEDDLRQALEMAEGSVRVSSMNRCRFYASADDLRWGLWGILMDATSPRGSVEFLKYAQWRLLRCRMALGTMPLDTMLSRV
jgi:thiamine kinase-like enzyme